MVQFLLLLHLSYDHGAMVGAVSSRIRHLLG